MSTLTTPTILSSTRPFAEDFHVAILNSLGLPDAMARQSYLDCERAYNTYPETRKILMRPNSDS